VFSLCVTSYPYKRPSRKDDSGFADGIQNGREVLSEFEDFNKATSEGFLAPSVTQSLHGRQEAWTYALVGGLLAGFLAKRASADADRAAAGAGVLGSVPAVVWALAYPVELALETGGAWWFSLAEALILVTFAGLVLTLGTMAGLLGGFVGRWLASFVDRRTTADG
jgi:hypothetical protein